MNCRGNPTPSPVTRRARLWLERLEERCVPSATDLGIAGEFNVFIFEDFTGTYSDVEGRLAVGRDASLTGYGVGDRLTDSNGTRDDLIVGDDLAYTHGQVFNGNIVYGDTAALTGVGIPNGTARQGTVIDFAAAQAELEGKSATWASYGTNGTIQNNWGGLYLTGTNPTLNVFNISATQLQGIWGLTIDAPAGSQVLVNVTGTDITLQYFGMNVNGTDPGRVLFNFHQAETITMQGVGFRGSILATEAAVNFNNGSMLGTVVAESFTGTGQMNLGPLSINIPEFRPASISGKVFNDKNRDEVQQADEPGMQNVTLVLQGDGVAIFLTTETNEQGHFTFTDLPPGHYLTAVIPPDGYSVASIHVGSEGGTKDLDGGQITAIPLEMGDNGIDYDFGLWHPDDDGGIEF